MDCLRCEKLKHWDPDIRRLAARALANMASVASLDPDYAMRVALPSTLRDSVSPDLVKRHGSCLAAAELTLALGKVNRRHR